ncbi:gametocyte-specific factor 1 homolog [Anopheles marshallii]|uniref:gametocyte-specific factor 1 homolog n=1 Tax=Anopheles marshallii TaxID=1521116 RepID=UPI00237BA104|nr:gametocyte-specific factor 1 homolog [Anopheles marshallii]
MNELHIDHYGAVIICPYNKAHVIPAARIQRHLFKCRRQYPNAKIDICCFNRAHHVPQQDLQQHQKNCPDRALIEVCKYVIDDGTASLYKPSPMDDQDPVEAVATQQYKQQDENWDDMDAQRYDPVQYCMENPVVRKTTGHMTPSEKRKFREEERIRISELNKAMESKGSTLQEAYK